MKIVTGGDSFAGHCIEPNIAWPHHIKNHEVIFGAEMASGNQLIARNVVHKIITNKDVDCVIIGWSDPNRFEFFFNDEESPYLEIKEHFKNNSGLTNQIVTGEWHPGAKSSWLKSGGGHGSWKFGNKYLDDKVSVYMKEFHNQEYQYIQTIESILRVQWLCESRNIRLLNFKAWHHNLFKHSYENVRELQKNIDTTTWWFYNKQGLKEWCEDRGFTDFPGGHPTTSAQEKFTKEVIQPWIDNG